MHFQRIVWSPVELEYLQKHKNDPVNQLCIALSKTRAAINKKLSELGSTTTPTITKPKHKKTRIGKRKDLDNVFYRSSWEANVARVLHILHGKTNVQYEPTTFSFAQFGIIKGTVSYCPDFRVTLSDGSYIWIEVKGYIKPDDKTKLRRFRKYYPDEFKKLVFITGSSTTKSTKFFESLNVPVYEFYNSLKKRYASQIPAWEK